MACARNAVSCLGPRRAYRLLLDEGAFTSADAARRMRLALSPGPNRRPVPGGSRASCASGTILLHDEDLFAVLDEWVADIPAGAIEAVLPLLRRTISSFPPPERRAIGERVSAGRRRHDGAGTHELDEARADLVLPILARILGVPQAQS